MKKSLLAVLMAGMTGMSAGAMQAQAEDSIISGDIGVYSQYMWRGMQQASGASVQGDLGVDIVDGLSANVWFAAPLGNNVAGGNVTEFDWTIDYSGEVSGLSYSLGYIYYSYLNGVSGNTGEIYAGVGYGPVAVTYYYATNSNRGGWKKNSYFDIALSQNVAGFDLGADFGFYLGKKANAANNQNNEFPTTKKGLGHVDLSISKDVTLSDGVTMTPSLMVSIPTWKSDNPATPRPKNTNQVVAAVNFSY
ncbi:MAG: TorF family putative porin [Mariprofundus sp.]